MGSTDNHVFELQQECINLHDSATGISQYQQGLKSFSERHGLYNVEFISDQEIISI